MSLGKRNVFLGLIIFHHRGGCWLAVLDCDKWHCSARGVSFEEQHQNNLPCVMSPILEFPLIFTISPSLCGQNHMNMGLWCPVCWWPQAAYSSTTTGPSFILPLQTQFPFLPLQLLFSHHAWYLPLFSGNELHATMTLIPFTRSLYILSKWKTEPLLQETHY